MKKFLIHLPVLIFLIISFTILASFTKKEDDKYIKTLILAHCHAKAEISVTSNCSGNITIENICKTNKSFIYIKTSSQSKYDEVWIDSTGYSKACTGTGYTLIIENIEKGKQGKSCDKKGPKDSDVKINFPTGCKLISLSKRIEGSTCTECGADFTDKEVYYE